MQAPSPAVWYAVPDTAPVPLPRAARPLSLMAACVVTTLYGVGGLLLALVVGAKEPRTSLIMAVVAGASLVAASKTADGSDRARHVLVALYVAGPILVMAAAWAFGSKLFYIIYYASLFLVIAHAVLISLLMTREANLYLRWPRVG